MKLDINIFGYIIIGFVIAFVMKIYFESDLFQLKCINQVFFILLLLIFPLSPFFPPPPSHRYQYHNRNDLLMPGQ